MAFTLALVTDLHFGPEARFEGKLRKLSHHAGALASRFVEEMNDGVRPDMVVNLGDDIEDESRELDLERYRECQAILRRAKAPLVNVAGNHDTINLKQSDLLSIWGGGEERLFYSFDRGGFHFAVLHTVERKGVDVHVPAAQIVWLSEDLARTKLPSVVLMHHSASEQALEDSFWFARHPHLALAKNRADVRRAIEESGKVRAVFNGHLHRNNLDVIGGIPYVTVQSLIENLDEDAPGRPAAAHAVVRLEERRMVVRVRGNDPARYQVEW